MTVRAILGKLFVVLQVLIAIAALVTISALVSSGANMDAQARPAQVQP